MLTWSTSDLARELHTDRNKIDNLRNAGLLHAIKIGKGFVFPEEEVKRFLREMLDKDISNQESIDEVREEMENVLK